VIFAAADFVGECAIPSSGVDGCPASTSSPFYITGPPVEDCEVRCAALHGLRVSFILSPFEHRVTPRRHIGASNQPEQRIHRGGGSTVGFRESNSMSPVCALKLARLGRGCRTRGQDRAGLQPPACIWRKFVKGIHVAQCTVAFVQYCADGASRAAGVCACSPLRVFIAEISQDALDIAPQAPDATGVDCARISCPRH